MNVPLVTQKVEIALPVSLSPEVVRQVLLETGSEPQPGQVFVVSDLLAVPREQRERLVALWERVSVRAASSGELRVCAYEWLKLDEDGWQVWEPDGSSVPLRDVFFPSSRRTLSLVEHAETALEDGALLLHMLRSAPVVSSLRDGTELGLEDVLDAFDRALTLARGVRELSEAGERASDAWGRRPIEINEDLIVLSIPDESRWPPVGLARASDPAAFAEARALLESLPSEQMLPAATDVVRQALNLHESYDRSVTDAELVQVTLKSVVQRALKEAAAEDSRRRLQETYEAERETWIEKHGSERLRLAAQRGYKHDGMYRDERLALELPGGFSGGFGKKAEVGEVVNPTEEGLAIETEVLEQLQAAGLSDQVDVQLVWVRRKPGAVVREGEYVEISNYLGRHKAYRAANVSEDDGDIPF